MKKNNPSQTTIFEWLQLAQDLAGHEAQVPESIDLAKEIKVAMTEDLKHAHDEQGREISRYQVAARMSEIIGDEITKTTIDNWTAPSHPHVISILNLHAFIRATGQRRVFEVLSRRSGLFTLPGPDALRAEIQHLNEDIKKKKAERLKRETFLREMENGR